MKKELAGIPLWIWGVGAVVVVGGFLWLRHQQAAKPAAGQGQGGGQYKSTDSINEQIKEWQSPPTTGGGGGGQGSIGPERKWLIHKTGSQHPWTWLAQHHERIEVGPHGSSWRIVKDGGGK